MTVAAVDETGLRQRRCEFRGEGDSFGSHLGRPEREHRRPGELPVAAVPPAGRRDGASPDPMLFAPEREQAALALAQKIERESLFAVFETDAGARLGAVRLHRAPARVRGRRPRRALLERLERLTPSCAHGPHRARAPPPWSTDTSHPDPASHEGPSSHPVRNVGIHPRERLSVVCRSEVEEPYEPPATRRRAASRVRRRGSA